jgi:EAL and modified HD-GYP domain-containing signal transduction protein
VLLLGTRRIREWVALMVLGSVAGGASSAQLGSAVARARMCQHVAAHTEVDSDVAFTAGLLVGIADLLGTPVAELVAGLPLSDDLAATLLRDEGRLAEVLHAVLAYERADLDAARHARLAPDRLVEAYLSAAVWSNRMVDTVVRGG